MLGIEPRNLHKYPKRYDACECGGPKVRRAVTCRACWRPHSYRPPLTDAECQEVAQRVDAYARILTQVAQAHLAGAPTILLP